MSNILNILLVSQGYELIHQLNHQLGECGYTYNVTRVATLPELAELSNKNDFDLVLGYCAENQELIEYARQLCKLVKHTTVIILTSETDIQKIIKCIHVGVHTVVNPNKSNELMDVVSQLFKHPQTNTSLRTGKTINPLVFRKLLEDIDHIAVQGYNSNGNVIYWNKGSEKLYGYSIDEVFGKNVLEIIIPEHFAHTVVSEIIEIMEKNIIPPPRNLTLKRKDGIEVNILSYYTLIENVFGQKEIFFIDIDQSLQVNITENLQTEKAYFESLFESSPLAIVVLDNNDCFIDCNQYFEQLFGYTKAESEGRRINELIVPDEMKDEGESLTSGVAKGQTIYKETIRKNKFGELIDVSIIGKPVFLKGSQISVLGIYQDITVRKESERALLMAKEKAESSDKLKTTFLNNISHEIRTPLNGIMGFANLIIKPNLSDQARLDYYHVLQNSCDRLLKTITNYMDASLLMSNYIAPHLKEVSLGSMIFDIYENYYDKVHGKGLGFSMHLPENSEDFIVKTDPEILRKIMLHLLDNAIKYTDEGRITLGFEFERNHLGLFVEDTGIGIPVEEQAKLFQHFSRIDNTDTPNYDGSGLSLSICKGLAKLLNSDVKVESGKGRGSKFSLVFNIEQVLINYDLSLKISEIRKIIENPVILVADDDQTSLMLLTRILKSKTDAKIIHAKNGREAVQLFQANPEVSCILMDLKMPYLNGYEATKQIKAINPDVPVIAVTAFAMVGDQKAAIDSGCDDYISKPFSIEQIAIILKKFGVPCK